MFLQDAVLGKDAVRVAGVGRKAMRRKRIVLSGALFPAIVSDQVDRAVVIGRMARVFMLVPIEISPATNRETAGHQHGETENSIAVMSERHEGRVGWFAEVRQPSECCGPTPWRLYDPLARVHAVLVWNGMQLRKIPRGRMSSRMPMLTPTPTPTPMLTPTLTPMPTMTSRSTQTSSH